MDCRPKCYPAVSAAVLELSTALEADPSNTRERVLFARLQRTVDVALYDYRSELIARGQLRSRCAFLHFSRYLRRFGWQWTESRLLGLHRLLRRSRAMEDCVAIEQDLVEALDTIDTLRSLVNSLSSYRPKASFVQGVNVRRTTWDRFCRFCDQPTEQQAFREGDDSPIQRAGSRRTLSPTLCCTHSSRREDGSHSSDYRRWLRNEAVLNHEIQELRWASVRRGARESSRDSLMLYAFRRRIVDLKNLHLYDEVELANEARALVKHGMTDRKKILVILLSIGLNPCRLAAELSISKQAVYKAIASLPDVYKFA